MHTRVQEIVLQHGAITQMDPLNRIATALESLAEYARSERIISVDIIKCRGTTDMQDLWVVTSHGRVLKFRHSKRGNIPIQEWYVQVTPIDPFEE